MSEERKEFEIGMCELVYVVLNEDENRKPYLFRAPVYSYLKEGDRVMVMTKHGPKEGRVLRSVEVGGLLESDIVEFFTKGTGVRFPLAKVISRVVESPLRYYGEEQEEQQ